MGICQARVIYKLSLTSMAFVVERFNRHPVNGLVKAAEINRKAPVIFLMVVSIRFTEAER